jgi:hypothetical protein
MVSSTGIDAPDASGEGVKTFRRAVSLYRYKVFEGDGDANGEGTGLGFSFFPCFSAILLFLFDPVYQRTQSRI